MKKILISLFKLSIILVISIVITKRLSCLKANAKSKWFEYKYYILTKKLKSIKLYEKGLTDCYQHQGDTGCGVIGVKLLQLKDDYKQGATDYNKKAKLFNWKACSVCQNIPKVYEIEEGI